MPRAKRILYLQTEDWAFLLHRLPMARAARDAGYEVHVATRVGDRRGDIEAEGFSVHPLGWHRGSRAPHDALRAVTSIRRLLDAVEPDLLHNVAMKPVLLGSLASLRMPRLGVINSVAGLGSAFLATAPHKRLFAAALGRALRSLLNRANARTIIQNPDDHAFLRQLGISDDRLIMIEGSGVDTCALPPLPQPDPPITMAYVGRMLEDKGVRALIAAHGILAETGSAPRLLLAGTPDPENPTSIPTSELEDWNTRNGIEWLGHVSDIAAVWRRAHIAVLPSRREGLPKSLLEAAACARAMIASDAPGCRSIAIDGETALTHPIDDAPAIAAAIARLAGDDTLRQSFADAARDLVVARFSEDVIARQTVALYDALTG